jgi:endonuclease-3 related protein
MCVAEFFVNSFDYNLKKWGKIDTVEMRERLLKIKGVGEETADSILNYAFDKKIFVVDAYTKRLIFRHKLTEDNANYGELQKFFSDNLKGDVEDYKELHALIVMLGKNYCKPKPRCEFCPLNKYYKDI